MTEHQGWAWREMVELATWPVRELAERELGDVPEEAKAQVLAAVGIAYYQVGGMLGVTPKSLRKNIDILGEQCEEIIDALRGPPV